MTKQMNIQEFSERTGISKSALRYYEQRKLLLPKERGTNDYRIYTEDQIPTVKLISSLRLADVPIKDIKDYLMENDETNRQQMLGRWIEEIKKTRDVLNISLRYLESDFSRKEIYLIEKSAEQIIWYNAESTKGEFKDYFIKRGNELQKLNIPFKNCYLKYLSGKDFIRVQIGFGVPIDLNISNLPDDVLIEQMPQYLCIALSYKESLYTIQKGYEKLLTYALEHNWTPISPIIEWYYGANYTELDLLLPVTQFKNRGE